MSELDLDIGNYTIKELEAFFQFRPNAKYTAAEIELRETSIREQLLQSRTVNKRMKRDLISFLTSAKQWLIAARCSDSIPPPTSIPPNPRLDTLNYPVAPRMSEPRTDELVQRKPAPFVTAFNQEYHAGWMNPLLTKTLTKCVTIDTRFRDNYHTTSSSDFMLQLPMKISKAVTMQLSAFEFPVSFYGISEAYGNHYFYLEVTYTNNAGATVTDKDYVVLPSGNYNAQDLIALINGILSPTNENGDLIHPNSIFSYVQFVFDLSDSGSGTGKTYIEPTGTKANKITNIRLDFAYDLNGNVFEGDISTRIGWNLGYQHPRYDNGIRHISETIIEPITTRYIYLAVEDFNNSVNDHFVTVFKRHTLSPNILARIALKGSYFSLIMENNMNIVTEPRKYFGPVDITRLRIRIYDDRGRILSMNCSDFSFCLNFTLLYDV
jgi:hypothetical protein